MSNKKSTFILIMVFLVGLIILMYPTVSNYWNSIHSSHSIGVYSEVVAEMDNSEYDSLLSAAHEYNRLLLDKPGENKLSDQQKEQYTQLLDISGTGVMGYIDIDAIDVELPIYHTTDEGILQDAVGHLEWSSLPVGGESTHCVLAGHRGLPSAKLFTNINELVEGDVFTLRILDEELSYEVDQILIVEPQDTDNLKIVEGKDYCTLVTCTPYGINSHRLLVRGHRVENAEDAESLRITADAVVINKNLVAIFIAILLCLILLLGTKIISMINNKNAKKWG